jgi:hypothetical protein
MFRKKLKDLRQKARTKVKQVQISPHTSTFLPFDAPLSLLRPWNLKEVSTLGILVNLQCYDVARAQDHDVDINFPELSIGVLYE